MTMQAPFVGPASQPVLLRSDKSLRLINHVMQWLAGTPAMEIGYKLLGKRFTPPKEIAGDLRGNMYIVKIP